MTSTREPAPRGRHAPPLAVRQDRQRERLFAAASTVFARLGYAEASAEAIAREAGMSKATFYEHFTNKEDCIIALFDVGSATVLSAMRAASAEGPADPPARYRAAISALLGALAAFPEAAQTLLVEIVGAGPRAREHRDRALLDFATFIDARNEADAAAGLVPRLTTLEDALAIVGAVVELASRQLRTGHPERLADLEPVVERLITGLLSTAEAGSVRAAA